MAEAREIRFAQVLRELLEERFKRRRKDLADLVHLSESSLSQYIRGSATPSLAVLVALARELDVSLDYLVFGVAPPPAAPDYGGVVAHVQDALVDVQTQAASLSDLVNRIGASLGRQIEATARKVIETADLAGGAVTRDEVSTLESFSLLTQIATVDLGMDMVELPPGPGGAAADAAGRQAAPGPLTSVIARNIGEARTYRYIIPDGLDWRARADLLRRTVISEGRLDADHVDRYLEFYQSGNALVPGYVLYSIDIESLQRRNRRLYEQVAPFIDEESRLLALVRPPSRRFQNYALVDTDVHGRMLLEHEKTVQASRLISFYGPP